MVSAVAAASQGLGNNNKDGSVTKLAEDFDDFLTLLTVQLQNQDPTAPMDTNQFTEQIVQFSTVEQSINVNKKLDTLVNLTQVGQAGNTISMIGKQAEVNGNLVTLPPEGGVDFAYNLEGKAKEVFITVKDVNGTTVFNGSGSTLEGRNIVTWEGNDDAGKRAPEGTYILSVTAGTGDPKVSPKTVDTMTKGTVQGVNLQANPPTVIVNNEEIPLGEINFVGA